MERFSVRIAGEEFSFSAAHFLAVSPRLCEPVHGHDYQVAVEIAGTLNKEHFVVDFVALRRALRGLIEQWNHRILLPEEGELLRVAKTDSGEIEVRAGDRRWVFPAADCCLLPVAGTTAELLARLLGERLGKWLLGAGCSNVCRLRVELKESPGCMAVWEKEF